MYLRCWTKTSNTSIATWVLTTILIPSSSYLLYDFNPNKTHAEQAIIGWNCLIVQKRLAQEQLPQSWRTSLLYPILFKALFKTVPYLSRCANPATVLYLLLSSWTGRDWLSENWRSGLRRGFSGLLLLFFRSSVAVLPVICCQVPLDIMPYLGQALSRILRWCQAVLRSSWVCNESRKILTWHCRQDGWGLSVSTDIRLRTHGLLSHVSALSIWDEIGVTCYLQIVEKWH